MRIEWSELDVPTVIEEAFAKATPIIHKESEYDYAILLITHCGIRIEDRVSSEQKAREVVNQMIAKMKNHPVVTNQTG